MIFQLFIKPYYKTFVFNVKSVDEKPKKPEEIAPSPKKLVHEKASMFNNAPNADAVLFSPERGPKQKLDQSKTSIFNQQSNNVTAEQVTASRESKPLDKSKMAMFNNQQQPAMETNQVRK